MPHRLLLLRRVRGGGRKKAEWDEECAQRELRMRHVGAAGRRGVEHDGVLHPSVLGGVDLLCSSCNNDGANDRCYYLSTKDGCLYTKDGKHPVDESRLLVPDLTDLPRDAGRHPTWQQVIEYLANEYR